MCKNVGTDKLTDIKQSDRQTVIYIRETDTCSQTSSHTHIRTHARTQTHRLTTHRQTDMQTDTDAHT